MDNFVIGIEGCKIRTRVALDDERVSVKGDASEESKLSILNNSSFTQLLLRIGGTRIFAKNFARSVRLIFRVVWRLTATQSPLRVMVFLGPQLSRKLNLFSLADSRDFFPTLYTILLLHTLFVRFIATKGL